MGFSLGTIFATLKVMDEMSPALKTAGYQLTNFGQGLSRTGTVLSGFTAAVVVAAKNTLELGGTFEQTTTRLVALAGVSKGELEGVRLKLLELAPAVGIGPNALSEAMYVVSSTLEDTAVAMEVLDVAAKGSAVGMGETKDVAKALVAIVNSYGKENISAARAGDILTRVIRDGGAEAAELAPRLAKVIPFASQLGISFEEVGANIATMTKLGVPASQAVTSLASVFAALARAVPRGQRALKEVGMTYAGLRAEIKEKGLTEAMIRLKETFKDNEEGLIDVVGRLEALKNVLGTTGPMAETYRKVLDQTKNSQGELADSFETASKTQKFMWDQLKAAIEVFWISLSTKLMPTIKSVIGIFQSWLPYLQSFVNFFAAAPAPIRDLLLIILALTAAMGPLLIIIGQMGMGFGYLMRGVELFTKETTSMKRAVAEATAAERIAIEIATIHANVGIMAAKAMEAKAKATLAAANATKLQMIADRDAAVAAQMNNPAFRLRGSDGQFISGIARARTAAAEKAAISAANAEKALGQSRKAAEQAALSLQKANLALSASNTVTAATTSTVAATTNTATGAFSRLFAVLRAHPFIAIASVIGAVAGAIWLLKRNTELNIEAVYKSADANIKDIEQLERMKKELDGNVFSSMNLKGIKDQLLKIAPEYLTRLSTEGAYYNQLKDSVNELIGKKKEMLEFDLRTAELSKDLLNLKRDQAKAELDMATARKAATRIEYQQDSSGVPRIVEIKLTAQELAKLTEAEIKARDAFREAELAVITNTEKIDVYNRILNKGARVAYETAKATEIFNLAMTDLAKGDTPARMAAGQALWNKGMQLAQKTQKDYTAALSDAKKMEELVTAVRNALIESQNRATSGTKELTKAEKELEAAREKANKQGWKSFEDYIQKVKEARKISADNLDKIEVLEADTAANLIAASGQVREAKLADVDTWVLKETNAAQKLPLTYWDYVRRMIAIALNAESQRAVIRYNADQKLKKYDEEYAQSLEKILLGTEGLWEDYYKSVANMTGNTYGVALAEINKKSILSIKQLEKAVSDAYDKINAKDNLKDEKIKNRERLMIALAAWQQRQTIQAVAGIEKEIAKLNELIRKRQQEIAVVQGLVALLDDIAEASGGSFGRLLSGISGVAKAWISASTAANSYLKASEELKKSIAMQDQLGISIAKVNKALAVMAGLQSLVAATGSGGTAQRTAGGAVSGAVLGNSIAPGIGAVIGGIAGGLTGLVRGLTSSTKALEAWQAQLERLAKNDDIRRSLNETYGSAERVASLFHAIGLENILLGDTSWMAAKKADQLREVIGRLTTEMNEIGESTRVASAELIAFRDAVPTDPLVMEFVLKQVQSAGSNVQTMLGSMQSSATAIATKKVREEIAILQEQIRQAEAAGRGQSSDDDITGDWRKRLKFLEEVRDATIGTIAITKSGAMAMSSILLASFDGTAQSLRDMQPALLTLQKAMKDSGIEGSAAFNNLVALANLATDEITGPMIDAINAGTNALVNMYNSGFLTQEVFTGMLGEIQAQRQALLANGATMDQVNQIMAPSLQKIWELWKDGKFEVDEVTLAQLKAAEAAGVVGESHRSATDRMVLALEKLAKMFETVFAEKLEDAAKRGAKAAQDQLNGIQMPPLVWNSPGIPNPGGGEEGGNNPPGFAQGTRGQFLDFGSGTLAVLHGKERIMTEGESGGGSLVINVNEPHVRSDEDIRKITRQVAEILPRHIKFIGGR